MRGISILGVKINDLTYRKTLSFIELAKERRVSTYICVAAVHLVVESFLSSSLRKQVNNASLVTPDGMPLVWLLQSRGFPHASRVYGPELMSRICQMSVEKKWKLALVGGAEGQSKLLKSMLEKKYPGIIIVGQIDTPNRLQNIQETKATLGLIKRSKPDIVFVGVGCPFQEKWMAENWSKVGHPTTCIGVGAAFDFISGRVKQAPPWMQRNGLEWLYRLWQDPQRLWKRYLLYNLIFLGAIVGDSLGFKLERGRVR